MGRRWPMLALSAAHGRPAWTGNLLQTRPATEPKSPRRFARLAAFLAVAVLGGVGGFVIAVVLSPRPESPSVRTVTAAYLASTSDTRPSGFSARTQEAANMWDARNAEGFHWAESLGVADRRDCPGDHGPFRAGCLEEADDRATQLGRR